MILAGLALADLDTCCLGNTLSNLGSYFPLHDLPTQVGFLYALSSLKRLNCFVRHVLAGVKAAGPEKVPVMLLLRIQHPYLANVRLLRRWATLWQSVCPTYICCLCGKIRIPPQALNINVYACLEGAHMGGKCFDKPRQSCCCCTWLMITLLLYKRTSLC